MCIARVSGLLACDAWPGAHANMHACTFAPSYWAHPGVHSTTWSFVALAGLARSGIVCTHACMHACPGLLVRSCAQVDPFTPWVPWHGFMPLAACMHAGWQWVDECAVHCRLPRPLRVGHLGGCACKHACMHLCAILLGAPWSHSQASRAQAWSAHRHACMRAMSSGSGGIIHLWVPFHGPKLVVGRKMPQLRMHACTQVARVWANSGFQQCTRHAYICIRVQSIHRSHATFAFVCSLLISPWPIPNCGE